MPITVGNGTTMSVTHRASTSIPTSKFPLLLHNVLVSPSLVKNLIFVRALTRDNNVSIEFDPFGFSVKDLPTRSVILRCDSNGELYPLIPAALEAHTATVPDIDLCICVWFTQGVVCFISPSLTSSLAPPNSRLLFVMLVSSTSMLDCCLLLQIQ